MAMLYWVAMSHCIAYCYMYILPNFNCLQLLHDFSTLYMCVILTSLLVINYANGYALLL